MSESNTPRRNLLVGAAAVIAGGAGAGLAWYRQRPAPAQPQATQAASAPVTDAAAGFWAARFERPLGGAELVAASLRGKPLLLNFWASWCAPCVKELPELAQFQRDFKAAGWQVLGLAIDSPDPVREFLQKMPLDFELGMAGPNGTELSRNLGNSQGGLPFSVAFDARGDVVWRKLGATHLQELREMATRIT
ncbi:MAG: TlpA disulfide reductase family protein [Burkholderiaceae bacterium]